MSRLKMVWVMFLLCLLSTIMAAQEVDSLVMQENVEDTDESLVYQKVAETVIVSDSSKNLSVYPPGAKRQFAPGFKNKYQDLKYEAKKQPKPSNLDPGFLNFLGKILVPLIKLLLLALGIWLIYILVTLLMGKKGNWLFTKKTDPLIRFGNENEAIEVSDYSSLIKKALHEGDYRSAIRYHYLNLLHKLHDKGKIEYHTEKTNADYIYEIREKPLARSFEYVSYIYDHAWYGEFEVRDEEYKRAENAFRDTLKMAGHG